MAVDRTGEPEVLMIGHPVKLWGPTVASKDEQMIDKLAIARMASDEEILATSEIMRQLRPHIGPGDYLPIVRRMIPTADSSFFARPVDQTL